MCAGALLECLSFTWLSVMRGACSWGRATSAALAHAEREVQERLGDRAEDCDGEHHDHQRRGNQRGPVRVLRLALGVKVVVHQGHRHRPPYQPSPPACNCFQFGGESWVWGPPAFNACACLQPPGRCVQGGHAHQLLRHCRQILLTPWQEADGAEPQDSPDDNHLLDSEIMSCLGRRRMGGEPQGSPDDDHLFDGQLLVARPPVVQEGEREHEGCPPQHRQQQQHAEEPHRLAEVRVLQQHRLHQQP